MYKTRTKFVWHLYDNDSNTHLGSRSFRSHALAEEWMEGQSILTLRKKFKFTTDYLAVHLYKVDDLKYTLLDSLSIALLKAKPAHEELAPKPTN
jgi:hypothetical protein